MSTRRATLIVMLAGTTLIAATAWYQPDIRFIWNASASVPIGLYRIVPVGEVAGERIKVTDLAVVMPPDKLAAFLAERRYLPRGVPLIKRVLALGGTEVCRLGADITAYGTNYGQARTHDMRNRPLPVWEGCHTLRDGEAFFMNWNSPDSFDSRYVGPLPISTIVGRAIPVWTTEDPDPAVDAFASRFPTSRDGLCLQPRKDRWNGADWNLHTQ